ncbi:MAG: MFS transporter [Actinobacteria bacterium]|nr:MFS transporter [Actinomycetota bacterium]
MSGTRRAVYYGWIVVAVAFLVMFVNYGVRSTQTVLIKGFSEDLGIGRGAASLPFTVCILAYALLAPVTGRLIDRFGPRWVMAGGAFLSGVGLWMCSRANSLAALVFFFGIVFGVGGNGIGLVPSNTSVAVWFRRRLGTALGLATMGIGFGTMILPRLTGMVQSRWGWRVSFQFLGYLAFALTIPTLFLLRGKGEVVIGDEEPVRRSVRGGGPRGEKDGDEWGCGGSGAGEDVAGDAWESRPGEGASGMAGKADHGGVTGRVGEGTASRGAGEGGSGGWGAGRRGAEKGDRGEENGPGEGEACREDLPAGLTLREALRTASFWLLFSGFVLIVVALYGIMVHQVPYLTDHGITKSWAEWAVAVSGATSIAGRLLFGRLSDRTREKKNALYPACLILVVSVLLLLFVRSVWTLMVFAVIYGFGFAAYGPVIPAVCAEVFGKANMGAIFGAVTTGGALGGAAGPVITGFIFDHTGSYTGAWILALACVVVSTLLFMRVRIMLPRGDALSCASSR